MMRVVLALLGASLVAVGLILGFLLLRKPEPVPAQVVAPAQVAQPETAPALATASHRKAAPIVNADGTASAAPAPGASADVAVAEEIDEPVTVKERKRPARPDPASDPEGFRQKLVTAGDPLLPEVEKVLAGRGIAATPAAATAAWEVARNWAIYLRAEAATKVDDAAARQEMVEARRQILINGPRELLTKVLGGKVDAALWTDLEALGARHQQAGAAKAPAQGASAPGSNAPQ